MIDGYKDVLSVHRSTILFRNLTGSEAPSESSQVVDRQSEIPENCTDHPGTVMLVGILVHHFPPNQLDTPLFAFAASSSTLRSALSMALLILLPASFRYCSARASASESLLFP